MDAFLSLVHAAVK